MGQAIAVKEEEYVIPNKDAVSDESRWEYAHTACYREATFQAQQDT